MRLDFSSAQAFGVQVHNPGIQAPQSGLTFLDQLRIERAFTISGRPCPLGAWLGSRGTLISSLSEFALHGFAVDSVAFVASFVADVLAWLVTQVGGHFSLEGSLEDRLGELFDQSVLAEQVFG